MLVLALGLFVWWALTPFGPDADALAALESADGISATVYADSYTLEPADDAARMGVILYPGARVDYRSYAPLARELASLGYLVVVPRLTLNLAVLDQNRADDVIANHPEIRTWAIGGHSLGGAMAAAYAENHPDTIDALVLLAAYPPEGSDLSDNDLAVVSVFGTRDGLLSQDTFEESAKLLPADTTWVPLDGGNHAQFGSYGAQPGDRPASMSSDDQQWLAATEIALALRPLRLRATGSP